MELWIHINDTETIRLPVTATHIRNQLEGKCEHNGMENGENWKPIKFVKKWTTSSKTNNKMKHREKIAITKFRTHFLI